MPNSKVKIGAERQAPNRSTTELPLLIAPMSSPTIGNTNVVGRALTPTNLFLQEPVSKFYYHQ